MRTRRFNPSAMLPIGSQLWVAEAHGTVWALLQGDPPSTAAAVDVGMVIAPSGPRPSASFVASAEALWGAVDQGVLVVSFDGAVQRLVDLGEAVAQLARLDPDLAARISEHRRIIAFRKHPDPRLRRRGRPPGVGYRRDEAARAAARDRILAAGGLKAVAIVPGNVAELR